MSTPKKNIHAQALGRLGGSKTSERKKRSSRLNGMISAMKRRLRRQAEEKDAARKSA